METARVKLSRLGHEHLPALAELERLCFSYHWNEDQFKLGLDQGAYQVWGAFHGELLAGYLAFWMVADEMEILNLAVRPDRRRQGVASALLRAVLAACRTKGVRQAFLDVRASNRAAVDLYRKFGFIQYGERKRYYPDTGENALLFRLDFYARGRVWTTPDRRGGGL